MQSDNKTVNKYLMIGWACLNIVLCTAYFAEYIKGARGIEYLVEFMLTAVVPEVIVSLLYMKNKESVKLKYYIIAGYFVMYSFVMLTGNTTLVFTYILPMLALLILYHNKNLVLGTGIATLVLNIICVIYWSSEGRITMADSHDVEIQLALIILCFAGCYAVARLYGRSDTKNKEYMKKLNENSMLVQEMALQSITTIANTIDAKDEYTKGHSQRVADYSYAIARELGMSPEEAADLYNVALLHDIGKIGVPDAILNKTGRLTDEEFKIIKTHPEVGAEILKDIRLLPGLDIGARYHHERYDGKGYPAGFKGEEIPYIARIICIADSYDAMSSSRVYRKRLSDERILSEIKRCRGTQFDPEIADALIRLMEKNEIQQMYADGRSPQATFMTRVDMDNLVKIMHENNAYSGALQLSYREFERVCEYVRNIGIRNAQSVQLILFTLQPKNGENLSAEMYNEAMCSVEKAIVETVRKVDITTRYSNTQQLLMCMNLKKENAGIVVERIKKIFYENYGRDDVNLLHSVTDVKM